MLTSEFELSKDIHTHTQANLDVNASFIQSFTIRKNLFSTDQEVFIDSQHPLILLNDTNAHAPLPTFYQGPAIRRTERKEEASQILSEVDTESPGLKKSGSSAQKLQLKTKSSAASRRRDHSQADSKDRRYSISASAAPSDTVGGKEAESEQGSPSKSRDQIEDEGEIDIFENKDEKKIKEANAELKKKLRAILDSTPFNIFIALITLYALFAQDICVAAFTESADFGFDVMSLIAMGIFFVEMILTIYAKKEYFLSFFFWLDLVSTVSIIFDIDFIMDRILYGDADVSTSANKDSVVSSIGTKAGRVFRVVRLVRLVKLYKQVTTNREQREAKKRQQVNPDNLDLSQSPTTRREINDQSFDTRRRMSRRTSFMNGSPLDKSTARPLKGRNSEFRGEHRKSRLGFATEGMSSKSFDKSPSQLDISAISRRKSIKLARTPVAAPKEVPAEQIVKESRVGKQLSELTTKRVIIMVLALLLFIPMFSADYFFDPSNSQSYQMDVIKAVFDSSATANAKTQVINTFVSQQAGNEPPLVYFSRAGTVVYSAPDVDISTLRSSEGAVITVTVSEGDLISIVSVRGQDQLDALLAIGRTFFICLLLSFGAIIFYKDARDLVLKPLERIILKVNKIAKNPLLAKDEEIVRDHSKGFDNETIHIENAIVKIGGLLALGFGDAGSAIIAQNIAKSGDINPMLPGKRKAAIYGFCDIRNFTDATEVLQEDVMVFVNSIAEVVHSMIDKFGGQANKNIGDAFLLVWKFPEDAVVEMADGQLEVISSQITTNIADCALISFLKIYARINRDPTLLKYRENPKLCSRLPNYKVKMGFGLHLGWAIEGAIGSEFKIDASYLSPNVNMASRLEAATKQYGVPLLFSGDLYEMMSDGLQDVSRLIDIVTVKGSIKPIELYTVDMDIEDISIAKDKAAEAKELKRVRQKQKKDRIKEMVETDFINSLLDTDKELVHMLRNKNEEFDSAFRAGFDAYIDGDWSLAKKKFEVCMGMRSDDGPTKNIVNFLAEYDYICPEDWDGYHVLTEK